MLAATSSAIVTEVCVQKFVTTMGSFKVKVVVVDQVHPLMLIVSHKDLSISLNKFTTSPPDFGILLRYG